MTHHYATVSIDGTVSDDGEHTYRVSYTDALGCTDTSVHTYQFPANRSMTLPADQEQVCIPIGSEDAVAIGGRPVPTPGVGHVPAGVDGSLRCDGRAAVFVVGASTASTGGDTAVVALDECEFVTPSSSDIATAHLTDALDCRGMKVNARRLHPGQRVPYHTEGDQEELFVPVRGPATMRVEDDTFPTPVGTLTRVAPPVPRSAINDGDSDALWVMIGAPPTGGATEWDPGASIVE